MADMEAETARSATERENLLAQIEAGEGLSTALQQLKEENVRHKWSHSSNNKSLSLATFVFSIERR